MGGVVERPGVILVLALLIFGCVSPPTSENGNSANLTEKIKLFECPNGEIVVNQSECLRCPLSCDDNNENTTDYCSSETSFKCVHIAQAVVNTNDSKIANDAPLENITPADSAPRSIVYMESESKELTGIINSERLAHYQKNSLLTNDQRLFFIAKKCNEQMLKTGKADLQICYDKYGAFKDLLSKFGFYGESFVYAAETAYGANVSRALFNNLTSKQRWLLVNQTMDLDQISPSIVDNAGVSVDCLGERCFSTIVTASNSVIDTRHYDNYWVYEYDLLANSKGAFIPQQFTLKTLDGSDASPSWCKTFVYNLSNSTYTQTSSSFWWSDAYEYASHGYNYEFRKDWDDYFSFKVTKPSIIYLWCYSTKDVGEKKKSGTSELCTDSTRDRFKVMRKYLPENKDLNESEMQKILDEASLSQNESSELSVLELLNKKRTEQGLTSLNHSKSLSILAQSLADEYVKTGDWEKSYYSVFGYNHSYAISYALATRNMFGYWAFSSKLLKAQSPYDRLDSIPDYLQEFFFGNTSSLGEYFGDGFACDGGVCASVLFIGSNRERTEFTNVRKYCGYGDTNCLYMNRYNYFTKTCGNSMDASLLASVSLKFNSSVPAKFYFYKNKYDSTDLYNLDSGYPKEGWTLRQDEYVTEYNITLNRSLWSVDYWPKVKNIEDKERFTVEVQHIPPQQPH